MRNGSYANVRDQVNDLLSQLGGTLRGLRYYSDLYCKIRREAYGKLTKRINN